MSFTDALQILFWVAFGIFAGWWVFFGRAEGMLGRTLGGPTTAVTR